MEGRVMVILALPVVVEAITSFASGLYSRIFAILFLFLKKSQKINQWGNTNG